MLSPAKGPSIRVVLVDDHPALREGTRFLLTQAPDIEVVGAAGEGGEALRLVDTHRPDVLLLDLRLPDVSGVAVAQRVRSWYPEVAVVVLTGYDDVGYVRALLQLGIQGYLRKTASAEEIVETVRLAARGELGPTSALEAFWKGAQPLTEREVEVLKLLAAGRRNQEICALLGLGMRTVEWHVTHIMEKVGAHSRTELPLKAQQLGLTLEAKGESEAR